jgi:hypothetical protein
VKASLVPFLEGESCCPSQGLFRVNRVNLTRSARFFRACDAKREQQNRRLRFAEKVRCRWRSRKWVVRWVVLLLDVCWQQAAEVVAVDTGEKRPEERLQRKARAGGRKKAA